jgi:cytochrome c oxidase subunit II
MRMTLSTLPIAGLMDGAQSALNPQGPAASEIAALSWLLFFGAAAIFAAVAAFTAYALLARRPRRVWMTRVAFIAAAGIGFPIVVLTALLIRVLVMPATAGHGSTATLRIEVVGEQWWWRVHYVDAAGVREFATANEIRLPVGETVELSLRTADVIHSFWVPALAPKLDMIPGRVNRMVVKADHPGELRGQCAEFCGGPHARMALHVIAMQPDEFASWRAQQRRPATPAATSTAERGAQAFHARGCGVCHDVRGTGESGTRGPDLTHVASRVSLGAATLPVGAGAFAAWIAASHHLKPGNLMPPYDMLPANEIGAIAAYLETLQ